MYEFLEYEVRDVMSEPISVSPETTLAEAEAILEKHGWNALPVVDGRGCLEGIVTSLDVLSAFAFTEESILPMYDDIMGRPVASVMTRDLRTVTPRARLTRVLQKILDTRNKSFPVVDDGRLVGIVAREDVMEALRRAHAGEKPGEGA